MCNRQDIPTAPPPAARLLPCARRAMSLIEIMIAIGILGLGLTMVAIIFPLALDQHRISTDRILSADVAVQMQSRMICDTGFLGGLNDGLSGTVYVVPFTTPVPRGDGSGTLDDNNISRDLDRLGSKGVPGGSVNNSQLIDWQDALYPVPTSSQDLNRRPRYFPISFYRKAQGVTQCTVFVCRRTGGQWFALQDETQFPDLADQVSDELVPLPWKLPVTLEDIDPTASVRWIFRLQGIRPNLSLEGLVRTGSKLLSQATGRIYTVINVNDGDDTPTDGSDDNMIFVLEDPRGEGPDLTKFNVWLVPGPVDPMTRSFGKSPVVDVLCFAGPG